MSDRLVRWLPVALVCGVVATIARRAAAPIHDPDSWWHLRLGHDLVAQHSLATPHHWSSFATVPWVPTEPLPEVVASFVERWFGLPGLAVLFAVAALAVALVVHATNRREAAPLPAAVATVFTVLAAARLAHPAPAAGLFVLIPVLLAAWLQTERRPEAALVAGPGGVGVVALPRLLVPGRRPGLRGGRRHPRLGSSGPPEPVSGSPPSRSARSPWWR